MAKIDSKKKGYHRQKVKGKSEPKIERIYPLDEFRLFKFMHIPHPAHIFGQQGNYYLCHLLTHSPKSRGSKNIEMVDNPNPQDNTSAYFQPKAQKIHKSKFTTTKPGWKLSVETDKQMQPYRKI